MRRAIVAVLVAAPSLAWIACAAPVPPPPASPPRALEANERPSSPQPPPSASLSSAPSASEASPSCRKLPPVLPTPEQPSSAFQRLPDLRMPGLVPGLPKEAPPALVAACRRLEQDNLRAEKTIPGRKVAVQQGAEPLHSGKCFSAKGTKGAWLVDLSPLRRARKGVVSYYQGTWSLLYVTPEGKRIAGGARGTIDALEGEWSNDFDVIGLHDFDADGVAEVMIAAESYTAIDGFHTEHTAWTFRDGSVVPFRPQLPQQGWLDVDADGRPDVLLPPLRGTRAYAVLHTLPDGSTHDDDDVVRASLARVCPAPPRGPLRVEREVLCALAWGATPAAVEQRIDDGRPRDTCRAVLFGLLRPVPVTPRLQGACPSEMRPPSDSEPGALAPPSCP